MEEKGTYDFSITRDYTTRPLAGIDTAKIPTVADLNLEELLIGLEQANITIDKNKSAHIHQPTPNHREPALLSTGSWKPASEYVLIGEDVKIKVTNFYSNDIKDSKEVVIGGPVNHKSGITVKIEYSPGKPIGLKEIEQAFNDVFERAHNKIAFR